jgi:hypothetical protein
VGPEVVAAAFYVFEPAMVARALPDAWARATPAAVLAARADLADATLRRALGDTAGGPEVAAAADLAVALARAAPLAGRTLAAAHAGVPVPDRDPLRRLWWAATVLREHRGDGHVAALLTAGLGPCEALVLAAAGGGYGEGGAELLRTSRQWSEGDWAAAADRLTARSLLTADGRPTDRGRATYADVEATTDRLAAEAYRPEVAADDDLDRLATALAPLARGLGEAGAVPFPNPVGVDPRAPATG